VGAVAVWVDALGNERRGMKNLRMKAARAAKDMSQGDLAVQVDVTRQTIGMIEAGDYNPTLKLCLRICRALDKTLDELFWEEETDGRTD
jgi:putative transcriptional regulator